jgi:hypothetical protein
MEGLAGSRPFRCLRTIQERSTLRCRVFKSWAQASCSERGVDTFVCSDDLGASSSFHGLSENGVTVMIVEDQ